MKERVESADKMGDIALVIEDACRCGSTLIHSALSRKSCASSALLSCSIAAVITWLAALCGLLRG